ncbi:PDZ and LIM domain protein 3-like isoform X1 [Petromyzon marinus]|uniref:PDZ and LIM domain protein 1-like isoform X1 n=1 Tax=Petromyzon marinus TaxID=7757 RepID=A0AAJ7SU50_PETMA|nr:PDZ and LIM domain protein 1-like isoform X1 [Petromyzon marinus]XP_032805678.1 PDZ and LIM domain protein 1-like isoform X1 [Petromyzon marinus]
MPQQVILTGPAPWGFRLVGGRDLDQPLTISRVTPGSVASSANLSPGDVILAIEGENAEEMTHAEAQERIKACSTATLTLKIDRPQTTLWRPNVLEEGKVHPYKVNLASEPQEVKPIGVGHNRKPAPFAPAGSAPKVIGPQYNNPAGLYSSDNLHHALQTQCAVAPPASRSPRISLSRQDEDYFEHKFNARPKPYVPPSGRTVTPPPSVDSGHVTPVPSSERSTPSLPPVEFIQPYVSHAVPSVSSGRNTPSVTSLLSVNPQDLKDMARAAPNKPIEVEVPGMKVFHAQFNSPMQLYSQDNIMDSLQGQVSSALACDSQQSEPHIPAVKGGLLADSEVYKLRQENQEGGYGPKQSGSFQRLQEMLEEAPGGSERTVGIRSVKAPVTKVGADVGGVQKLPICSKCGNGIVGPVVRARDKPHHPECFTCGDCGMNLKQKGFYFVDGQIYCDAHAKVRLQPPAGYELKAVSPK